MAGGKLILAVARYFLAIAKYYMAIAKYYMAIAKLYLAIAHFFCTIAAPLNANTCVARRCYYSIKKNSKTNHHDEESYNINYLLK